MSSCRIVLLALCLTAPVLLAQTPVADPPEPAASIIEMTVPETREPTTGRAAERKPGIALHGVAAHGMGVSPRTETFNGNSGALNVNEPTGVELEAFINTPNLFMQMGKSDSSSSFGVFNALDQALFKVRGDGHTTFASNNAERMRINVDGTMTLNYAGVYPARLLVQHGVDNSSALFVTHQPVVETNVTQYDKSLALQTTSNVNLGVTNSGALYGTHSWTYLAGKGVLTTVNGSVIETGTSDTGTITNAFGLKLTSVRFAGSTIVTGYGIYVSDVLANNDYAFYQEGTDDTNVFRGNIVIGPPIVAPDFIPPVANALNVNGNAHFNGTVTGTNIKAHYQDVAEWVPSTTDLAPGTVVVLNRERDNEVMASATAYDTTVAGVVSAQPGLSLGVEGEGKEQVATTGRVKVRVDARTKPIRVGDLLVTSDLAGTAMRSEPMDLNGRPFHQPGTIIGKALQSLEGGVGEILVLLSMQ